MRIVYEKIQVIMKNKAAIILLISSLLISFQNAVFGQDPSVILTHLDLKSKPMLKDSVRFIGW